MVMNPRTHPRGAPPDFTLPEPNPNPRRITDALWWLRCMRLRLEPLSDDGGILAIKPGYHSYGSRLPGAGSGGAGKSTTDHSIRRTPDRTGPWWEDFAAAHDWTFTRAHRGDYTEIKLYTGRLVTAMRSLTDLRPDDVYAYTIGQVDNDRTVEGWNEYVDDDESGDSSHLWHRHDSFRRNAVGDFWAMWKALTIDMGWTYAEWLASTTSQEDDMPSTDEIVKALLNHDLGKPGGGDTVGVALQDGLQNSKRALAELAELRVELERLQQPTITLTVEQVESVGAILAEAAGGALVDLRQRLQAAGVALAAPAA